MVDIDEQAKTARITAQVVWLITKSTHYTALSQ